MFRLQLAAANLRLISPLTLGRLPPPSKRAHCRNSCEIGPDGQSHACIDDEAARGLARPHMAAGGIRLRSNTTARRSAAAMSTIDPARQAQYASANWNRVYLCGAEPGLDSGRPGAADRAVHGRGRGRFFAWLSPGPDMDTVRGWLTQAGFAPRMQWNALPDALFAHLSSRRRSGPTSWCGRRAEATSRRRTKRSAT